MSPSMYLIENTWVIVDIRATTSNITIVILSIRKPISIRKAPRSIQSIEASWLNPGSWESSILPNIASDKTRVMRTEPIATQSPCRGKRLPAKIKIMNDNSGKNRIASA